jgi:hypothetical protein
VFDVLCACWDLIIAHPPCTHLAVSGAKHFEKKKIDGRQATAISFFMQMVNAPAQKIVIENPVGIMSTLYREPDQIIQPWQFGDEFQKTTCLWLKGVSPLQHTNIVGKGEFVTTPSGKRLPKWYSDNKSSKVRSRTFDGIANAMAEQWGGASCAKKSGQKNNTKESLQTAHNSAMVPCLECGRDSVPICEVCMGKMLVAFVKHAQHQ